MQSFRPATRSRTGCLTCRRRRKKCDEHKPQCHNCLRNSLECDGYQTRIAWEPGKRRRNVQRSMRAQDDREEEQLSDKSSPGPQRPTPVHEALVPKPRPSLPSLIDGVETVSEKRLYHHFSSVLTQLLVLQNSNDCNPIATAILPLSAFNKGLLSLVMAVSAAHYLKLMQFEGNSVGTSEYLEIQRLKWKFFGQGTRIHGKLIQELYADEAVSVSDSGCTIALANTMLLCQFNTGEGGFDGGWKMHLDAAQELVKCLRQRSSTSNMNSSSTTVLEDWFLYHKLIARVTENEPSHYPSHINAFSNPHPILIGSQDGLLLIVERIMDLKLQMLTEQNSSVPSFSGLTFGLEISGCLEAWDYQYPTPQQRIVGECYRWAAFILLYATVYKCQVHDMKIQTALQGGLTHLDDLCDTYNAQICALFPMFIFGVSATSLEARNQIRKKMDAYYQWSGLGNILESKILLELWWQKCEQIKDTEWWQWREFALDTGLYPILT